MLSTIPKPVLPFRDGLLVESVEKMLGESFGDDITMYIALGFRADIVQAALGSERRYLVHRATNGLAFRVADALDRLRQHAGPTLVTYADTPNLASDSLSRLVEAAWPERTFAFLESATSLPGLVLKRGGTPTKIIQRRLVTKPPPAASGDVGAYAFRNTAEFRSVLGGIRNDNHRREFVFADVVEALSIAGWNIVPVQQPPTGAGGANTPREFLRQERELDHGPRQLAQREEADDGVPLAFLDWWHEMWNCVA